MSRGCRHCQMGDTGEITSLPAPGRNPVVYDLAWLTEPDLGDIDALASLTLAARRHGCDLVLTGCSAELHELTACVGLAGILPLARHTSAEPRRHAEEREEALGIQEERDARDLSA